MLRFGEGIRLDYESWYSATPEKIATEIARRCEGAALVVDGFCGAGSNAIHFARHCGRVVAMDVDHKKLALARNNARVYEVEVGCFEIRHSPDLD